MSDDQPAAKAPQQKQLLAELIEGLRPEDILPRIPGRDRLLTTAQAAAMLNRKQHQVRQEVYNWTTEFPHLRVGRAMRFWESDIREFAEHGQRLRWPQTPDE
ncbi:helix-turn-helix domain-containing protein [Alienimonas sp. DA493]|uniref:helix-turn-helix domain-containing protein n=1 Tax=Alienimonas sp. DA493 TaxID=3373605 RepID=UPI0037545A9D